MDEQTKQLIAKLVEKIEQVIVRQDSLRLNVDGLRLNVDAIRNQLDRIEAGSSRQGSSTSSSIKKAACLECGTLVLPKNMTRHLKTCVIANNKDAFDINQPGDDPPVREETPIITPRLPLRPPRVDMPLRAPTPPRTETPTDKSEEDSSSEGSSVGPLTRRRKRAADRKDSNSDSYSEEISPPLPKRGRGRPPGPVRGRGRAPRP